MGGAASSTKYKDNDIIPLINPTAISKNLNLHLPQSIQTSPQSLTLKNKQPIFSIEHLDAMLGDKYRLISVHGKVNHDNDNNNTESNANTTILGEELLSNRPVSIKCIAIKSEEETSHNREINILQTLSNHHPGIVSFINAYTDPSYLYIITEHVESNIDTIMQQHHKQQRTLDITRTLNIFHQILLALQFCHVNHIYYYYLQPENVLVDQNDNIKLTGFDHAFSFRNNDILEKPNNNVKTSNAVDDERISDWRSTRSETLEAIFGFHLLDSHEHAYISPELLNGIAKKKKLFHNAIGKASDLWSCGCILVYMCKGSPPFGTIDDKGGLKKLIRRIKTKPPALDGCHSLELTHLCNSLLQKKPQNRITIEEALHHAWFHEATVANGRVKQVDMKYDSAAIPAASNTFTFKHGNILHHASIETNVLQAKVRREASIKLGSIMRGNLVRLDDQRKYYAAVDIQSVIRGGIQRSPVNKSLQHTSSSPSLINRRPQHMNLSNLQVDSTIIRDTRIEGKQNQNIETLTVNVQLGKGMNGGRSTLNGTIDAKLILPVS